MSDAEKRAGAGEQLVGERAGDHAADEQPGDHVRDARIAARRPDRRSSDGASVLRFPSRPGHSPTEDQPENLRTALGEVLRDERARQERTLADVADDASVSVAYLSEIERARKDVSSELLGAVCDALDIPLATVLERCADRLRAGAQRGVGVQLRAA